MGAGLNALKGTALPGEMVPAELTETLEDENWQLLHIGSAYKVASDEGERSVRYAERSE